MNQKELKYFHSDDGRKLNKKLSHNRFRNYLKKLMIEDIKCENHGE